MRRIYRLRFGVDADDDLLDGAQIAGDVSRLHGDHSFSRSELCLEGNLEAVLSGAAG